MAVRELGAERVIYGSDAGGRSFASQLAKVYGADVPDSAKSSSSRATSSGCSGRSSRPRGSAVTPRIIDTNVNLSRMAPRRVPDDETAHLVATLSSHGVVEAWAGSFDGLLHKDLAGVNARLAQECRAQQSRVRSCRSAQSTRHSRIGRKTSGVVPRSTEMPGIRLHPNYHGYKLDHPAFAQLLAMAAKRGLVVGLCLRWRTSG